MKIHYFDGYGRAEPMKLLFKHAKVAYEFCAIEREKWPEIKESGKFDFKQVPSLEMDGKYYVQSGAILAMLGLKYGYFPKEPELAYEVYWWIGGFEDIIGKAIPAMYNENEEAKKKAGEAFFSTHLPFYLGVFEKKLAAKEKKDFLVGDALSIADFSCIGLCQMFLKREEVSAPFGGVLEKFPTIKKYVDDKVKEFY